MYFGKTCGARWPHRLYIDLPLIASMPVVFMIRSKLYAMWNSTDSSELQQKRLTYYHQLAGI